MAKAAKKAVKKATAKRAPGEARSGQEGHQGSEEAGQEGCKEEARSLRLTFLFCSRLGTGRGAGPQDRINF